MLGEFLRTRNLPITETIGVVGAHRLLVISTIFIYQLDAFYRVFLPIQLFENLLQILGDGTMTDQFALAHLPLAVVVQQAQMPQVASLDIRVGHKRLPVDTLKQRIADGFNDEL